MLDETREGVNNMNDDRLTLSVEEAAKCLGIGRNAAYSGVANGSIPSIRIGSRILIPTCQLEKLLAGEQTPPPNNAK